MNKITHLLSTGLLALGVSSCSGHPKTHTVSPQEVAQAQEVWDLFQNIRTLNKEIKALLEKRKELLSAPCDENDLQKIAKSREWITAHLPDLKRKIDHDCQAKEDCEVNPAFWNNFESSLQLSTVFCPYKKNGISPLDKHTAASVVDDRTETSSGSYAVYEVSSLPPCVLADSMSHEITHLASGKGHKNSDTSNDWIYFIGNEIGEACNKER